VLPGGIFLTVAVSAPSAATPWGQLSRVDRCGPGPTVRVAAISGPGTTPGAATEGPDAAAAGSDPASAGPDPASAGPEAGAPGRDQANAEPVAVPITAPAANVRVSDSGSQFPPGCRAPISDSSPPAVGRCVESLARQRSTSGRTVAGTCSRLGAPWATRYSRAAVVPVPNGPSPVAAKASTAPKLKMSLGGPTS
jgi:hypothetical protein